jgi:hypothetical protein
VIGLKVVVCDNTAFEVRRLESPSSSIPHRRFDVENPMKIMAIGSIVKPVTPEQRQQIMPKEVPATLKLYLDGRIEQFWYRQDAPGVIFLMNADTVEQAKAAIEALPLVTEGFAEYQFMQIGPLAPLGLLIP